MPDVLTLMVVGFLAGLVTGLSPCVLPVLPVVLGASATSDQPSRRRPVLIVSALVATFALATLTGSALLSVLGLPQDFLRWVGIAVLVVVGVGLLVPAVGHAIERPFARIPQRALDTDGSAVVLGASFGLVFVPCAGPVLAAITVLSAGGGLSAGLLVLTASFAAGLAVPLMAFALAGQGMGRRIRAARRGLVWLRAGTGVIMLVTAAALALNVTEPLQRYVPGYLAAAQARIEDGEAAREALDTLGGRSAPESAAGLSFDACAQDPSKLRDCGPARNIVGIQEWLNSKPLNLDDLRGQVVLIDFWTYSCINCQRTLPYLTAWDDRYRDDGLTIIGVHSPEFAFEKEVGNVADNAERLGVRYPIAIDNDFDTWREWDQRYWPAHYLIDQSGTVRQVHYGEGAYEQTEALISQLLDEPVGEVSAQEPSHTSGRTPETYLGHLRAGSVVNLRSDLFDADASYRSERVSRDEVALDGRWRVEEERIVAGEDAGLALRYYAGDVFLVLGGRGTVRVADGDDPPRTIEVAGSPTLYPLASHGPDERLLLLDFSPGVEAYAFTFG